MTEPFGPIHNLTLGAIRRELAELIALADTAERPKPTAINPTDHPMPGHEWTVVEQGHPHTSRSYPWVVRAVDDPAHADAVYVSSPDCANPGEDFTPMNPTDARRIGLAFLAAADRADHLARCVPRLEDHWRVAGHAATTDTASPPRSTPLQPKETR
ncbi:hypothetical protein [Streptomyces cucumeris]|uniref:hypothetical protein n=1 Tax=Streptomyces cucumeris TaxID=2962890 RepID=UPI0020C8685F|nr:hypothetical protein [Streptomyces sp. NEAU-Y11]MCP9209525.1 hypothetical protein [Streptomyces sp. NEAU-Y11]